MSTVTIHVGSNLDILPTLAENSIDAIVTDPPYGLEFMGKEWDAPWKQVWQSGGSFSKPGIGERQTEWPSFSSTSKFGSPNPTCAKCGGRARGKKRCKCEQPDWKPIGKRRNPENEGLPEDVTSSGMTKQMKAFQYWCELWARQCLRVLKPGGHLLAFSGSRTYHRMTCAIEDAGFEVRDQIMWVYGSGFPKSLNVGKKIEGWDGWGTALKPAHEPICVARKPLNGTVADNVMKWGTGAINVDGCRVGTDFIKTQAKSKGSSFSSVEPKQSFNGCKESEHQGRWPANFIHDGSQDVLELFPETGPSKASKRGARPHYNGQVMKDLAERGHDDNGGSAARFFYCPKASKKDRDDGCEGMEEKKADTRTETAAGHWKSPVRHNFHPTVKPTELMRYLCRLVTPPGGTVLDPFMGSGSTGRGAVLEGFAFTGIELSDEYAVIARARIDAALKSRQTPS